MAGVMAWRVPAIDWWRRRPDQRDLVAIEMLYVAVGGLFWPIFPCWAGAPACSSTAGTPSAAL